VELAAEGERMERTTSADGTAIAFDRSGTGPAVVLVGGALGDRSVATPLAARLATRFTVIAFDRRGRGDSGDTAPYAVEREIEDITALLDEVDAPTSLFGHSSGAVLALDAANALRGRIGKLAVYEPPLIVDESRPLLPEDYVEHLETLVAQDRRGDAVAYFMTEGPGVPPGVVASMRSDPSWPSFEALAHTLAYDGTIMAGLMSGSAAPLERWSSLDVPVLAMDGGSSPPWQRNAVGALVARLPNAERRTLVGQDHGPADDVLAPVLVDFFAPETARATGAPHDGLGAGDHVREPP
jgi:pimeloyl-ACP methyl ester carboxylesterase